jgi:DNA-binding NarL/FixJ family response regulator
MKIKLLLVDDQILFVRSLKVVLQNLAKDIEVIGIAEDGKKALEFINGSNIPDIILMDIKMPQMDGIEVTKIIHEKYPDVKILILSTYLENSFLEKALENGAVGYLLKTVEPSNLIDAIRIIKNESVIITPHLASDLAKKETEIKRENKIEFSKYDKERLDNLLSKREKEIFNLILKGNTNKEIASELYISPQTVRNHITIIYSKLGINNRLKLINSYHSDIFNI